MTSLPESTCPYCQDSARSFTSRGLKIHITRMHKDIPRLPASQPALPVVSVQPICDHGPDSCTIDQLANLRASVRVLRHIPKAARNMAADKLCRIIDNCITANGVDDWLSLLSFSYRALRTPDATGKGSLTSKVKANIDAFSFLPSDSNMGSCGSHSLARTIESKVHEGDLRGAVRLLMSEDSIAPVGPETTAALQSKHPSPSRTLFFPPEPDKAIPTLSVSVEDVVLANNSFHNGSAAGLDGFRPGHLKELTSGTAGDGGRRLIESITKLCNFMLSGQLTPIVCPYMYGATLCALRKKEGGIRPIAVGSTFRRLVAKLGCRAVKEDMASYLQPHQLGFRTRLGCEAAIHAVRAFVLDPENLGSIIAFMAMCKRQCGLSVGEAELPTRADLKAEPIGEERAIATLERIDLLRVLREEVAPHPDLETRLALCERSSDTPPWWQPASQDKLLVLAVCKHGLGDSYSKLFCDPKMPFADCARKWYSSHKVTTKANEPVKASSEDEEISETRMSLRRSSRRAPQERDEEDTHALSELETLTKLSHVDEPLPPECWFTERALETRLHHIAHAVQNCEWPAALVAASVKEPDKTHGKRNIAIDVETERAKLHALLTSPVAAHSASRETRTHQDRDDASSDSGSRRSTPAPPPAHQHLAPSPAAAPALPITVASPPPATPVDLSAPRDLNEARDFSIGRRAQLDASALHRSRLDDTLSRLMKRKNVPAPELIVGKEKKRKKLDEIVLGLSAAKGQSSLSGSGNETSGGESARACGVAILPDVTVTPASALPSVMKPFSVTLTNVPSLQSTSKEMSSFFHQSLEQNKCQKAAGTISPAKSYSHEAKVNKWLAEQASVDSRRRTCSAPCLAPDERVPVVHRVTGKRIQGHKAPQLKQLAQWIAENPMYDIDSKWTESIKEHVKLPQDTRSQRHSPMQSTNALTERKKARSFTQDSTSTNVLSSSSHLAQNLAALSPALLASLSSLSALDPKTLAATLSNLTGFDSKLLNTFDPKLLASLNNYDPKHNPLLNSFGGIPNILGNLTGGNIFANLAGLGLSGFSSLDISALGGPSAPGDSKNKTSSSSTSKSAAASNCKVTNSQFPFAFSNPNMLYPQLGLGGLNPFGMHTGMSSAYDALNLLSNNLSATSNATSMHNSSRHSNTKNTTSRSSTVVTSSGNTRPQKIADRQQSSQLPQILLPPGPYLLESLSKQSINYESLFFGDKRNRESKNHETKATDISKLDKQKPQHDALRSHFPPEFAAVQEKLLKGDKKDIDISKMLLEQMASGALSASLVSSTEVKRNKDTDKDAYEKLEKSCSEYISQALTTDENVSSSHKRTHNEITREPENLTIQLEHSLAKKLKDSHPSSSEDMDKKVEPSAQHTGEMDIEDLIAPTTVIKTGMKTSDFESSGHKMTTKESSSPAPVNSDNDEKKQENKTNLYSVYRDDVVQSGNGNSQKTDNLKSDNERDNNTVSNEDTSFNDIVPTSKKRGFKSSEEIEGPGSRRELRSSAGRLTTEANN